MGTNQEYFKTNDFYLAAFLSSRGFTLTGIDRTNPRRCQFVFIDTPLREKTVEAFNFGTAECPEVMIDARNLINAIRQLKEKLYQE